MKPELLAALHNYCSTQNDFFEVETYMAGLQGKGWGTATIDAEVNACLSLIDEPKVFIDIGANKGIYTQTLVSRFPSLKCHLFEPSSANISLLNSIYSDSENVVVNPYALSNKKDSLTLYTNIPGSGLASLTKRNIDHVNIKMDIEETVDVIRFDEYWKGGDIDYVKIDVEGHELDVLSGFGDILNRTKLVQFEFGGCNIDTKTHYRDFWYYFRDRGFDLYRITPYGAAPLNRYTEYDEHYMTTNYIAHNKGVL